MKIFSLTVHGGDIVTERLFMERLFFVPIVNSWNRLLVEVRCSASMVISKRTCFMFLAGDAGDEQE
jgi:hypothetical protein